jgi:hypothetical protein
MGLEAVVIVPSFTDARQVPAMSSVAAFTARVAGDREGQP